jgi:hypothetical protein
VDSDDKDDRPVLGVDRAVRSAVLIKRPRASRATVRFLVRFWLDVAGYGSDDCERKRWTVDVERWTVMVSDCRGYG